MIRASRLLSTSAISLIAAATLACSSDPSSPIDEQRVICARLDAALASVIPEAPGTQYQIDAQQEVVARVVAGGFAGILFTGQPDRVDGHTIMLVYPDSAAATRHAATLATACTSDVSLELLFQGVAQSVDVQPAQWDMITLRQWERELRILAAEVTGTTPNTWIGTWLNTIWVTVPDDAARQRVEEGAHELGIPESAIVVQLPPLASAALGTPAT